MTVNRPQAAVRPRLIAAFCGLMSSGQLKEPRWPEWRNGRRRGLKIPRLHGRESSSLSSGTKIFQGKWITFHSSRIHGVLNAPQSNSAEFWQAGFLCLNS